MFTVMECQHVSLEEQHVVEDKVEGASKMRGGGENEQHHGCGHSEDAHVEKQIHNR